MPFGAEIMSLTAEQLDQSQREGYVVAGDVPGPGEGLQTIIGQFAEALGRMPRPIHAAGENRCSHAGPPFEQRAHPLT